MIRLAIPGDIATPTGGYEYARRIVAESGGALTPVSLPGGFPHPSGEDLAVAAGALAADAPTLIDGLAYGALPAALIAALPRPPVALCHHPLGLETGLDAYESAILLKREAAALARAAHVVVTSDETKRILCADLGQAPDRITVAPPGLDWAEAPARAETGAPQILTVASLTPRKGHLDLVAALARLSERAWTARWVGPLDRDPGHLEQVKVAIVAAGLSARVRIEGALSGQALEAAYAEADIFCLPSRYEGYGMAFAEAMMRGLPVVGCDTGAVAALCPPRAALLTPPGRPEALAEALDLLLGDPPIRAAMGAAGRSRALDLPGWGETWAVIRAVMARFG